MKINHVCFDLDGTLVRSNKTIYKATLTALEILGTPGTIDEEKFNEMIGLHFIDIFNEFKVKLEDFEKFIDVYKSVYFDFINESELYPDVEETLLSLYQLNHIKTSLLTTKGQDQAEKIIKHFGLAKYFDFIMGRRNGIAHKPSPEPLLYICKNVNVGAETSIIVGDTELDIICGKNAGAVTCGVTYGYRTKEFLLQNNPDYLIEEISEIKTICSENN